MKVTKVKVNKGVTVNLGNFNSFRYDLELSAEVGEGEDHLQVALDLGKEIDALIEEETPER